MLCGSNKKALGDKSVAVVREGIETVGSSPQAFF